MAGAVFVPPILALFRDSSTGHPSPPPGGTTTSEASYEPVQQPEDRRGQS